MPAVAVSAFIFRGAGRKGLRLLYLEGRVGLVLDTLLHLDGRGRRGRDVVLRAEGRSRRRAGVGTTPQVEGRRAALPPAPSQGTSSLANHHGQRGGQTHVRLLATRHREHGRCVALRQDRRRGGVGVWGLAAACRALVVYDDPGSPQRTIGVSDDRSLIGALIYYLGDRARLHCQCLGAYAGRQPALLPTPPRR